MHRSSKRYDLLPLPADEYRDWAMAMMSLAFDHHSGLSIALNPLDHTTLFDEASVAGQLERPVPPMASDCSSRQAF